MSSSRLSSLPGQSPLEAGEAEALQAMDVFQYHRRSKHAPGAYAAGPGTIDWEQQPDPFRRFSGAPIIELPLEQNTESTEGIDFYSVDFNTIATGQAVAEQPLSLSSLARWLQFSLALSARKQYGGSSWSLRCNPSSGNLHPTEAYLLVRGMDELADGVYHYRADAHALEQRCLFASRLEVGPPQVYLGFSSLHWREAWKYGERAYRYCQLDIGHALACTGVAAAMSGWTLQTLDIDSNTLANVMGLDRVDDFIAEEREWPDVLLRLGYLPPGHQTQPVDLYSDLIALQTAASKGDWQGTAEVIDRKHFYRWPVIDVVAGQAQKPVLTEQESKGHDTGSQPLPVAQQGAYRETLAEIIPRRRSAQAFNRDIEISSEQFFVMLDHLLPREHIAPWSSLAGKPVMHCVLFVHRVNGLAPGLYALPRTENGEQKMRGAMREEFNWQPVDGAPSHLPLYELLRAKAERTAANLSCQQAIAADGVFSLAMLAEYSDTLEGRPWLYPELFWEAGAIGQALYLEAEGVGLQGTGIGCYFDDAVHQLLGISDESLQVMYHFTVGQAIRDARIVSYAPYGKRQDWSMS